MYCLANTKYGQFTNTRTNLRKYAQHRLLEDQKGNKLIKIDMETLRGIAYKSKVLFYEVCNTMQTSPQKLLLLRCLNCDEPTPLNGGVF
jgi:hypothetical protein